MIRSDGRYMQEVHMRHCTPLKRRIWEERDEMRVGQAQREALRGRFALCDHDTWPELSESPQLAPDRSRRDQRKWASSSDDISHQTRSPGFHLSMTVMSWANELFQQ